MGRKERNDKPVKTVKAVVSPNTIRKLHLIRGTFHTFSRFIEKAERWVKRFSGPYGLYRP